jgi:hypothetical protein
VRFLRTTAGAIGTRLSLRPSFERRVKRIQTSGDQRREKAKVCLLGILNCHRPRRRAIQYAAASRLKP